MVYSIRRPMTLLLSLAACGGDKDGEPEQSTAEYACLHVAEGTILDVSLDRATAQTITAGREPYRVNLFPNEPGYLQLDPSASGTLVVLADEVGAVPAVWHGDEREELGEGVPNSFCDEDIPTLIEIDVSGTTWLEIGPVFQANVWLMVAPP